MTTNKAVESAGNFLSRVKIHFAAMKISLVAWSGWNFRAVDV